MGARAGAAPSSQLESASSIDFSATILEFFMELQVKIAYLNG
jgi:hypothetical protein